MQHESGSLPTLSTARLSFRPVTIDDLSELVELNADPEVMAHILGRPATPAETETEWRQRLEAQSNPGVGLGYWMGYEHGAFVGWWSASWFAPDPKVSGIGYRLRTSAWGRGLATEGARAMVAQAFAGTGIESVLASTMAANTGSRRVLEKVGFTHTGTWSARRDVLPPGVESAEVGYELTAGEWARREAGR